MCAVCEIFIGIYVRICKYVCTYVYAHCARGYGTPLNFSEYVGHWGIVEVKLMHVGKVSTFQDSSVLSDLSYIYICIYIRTYI